MLEFITVKRLACSLALWTCMAASVPTAVLAQKPALATPDFTLRSLTGENLRLSEFRGNVVVLGFWARWCGDCRQAMQSLNDVQAKYERTGLITWGINIGDSVDQAAAMAKNLGLTYPILVDTDQTTSLQFDIKAMPLILLIDREGHVRFTHAGFERGQEQKIIEHLRQLLNE